ncbi:MAG: hypothetical protein PHD03_01435 [Bacilli bacterium]|nr:hypothetical protein [Bacilli bacterium]MDD4406909.1 hypothetical protein [Bacilli bacterium]
MKIDENLLKKIALAIAGLILLIIIITLITSCGKNKKYNFEELEDRLIVLTKNYYEDNKKELPDEGKTTSVSAQHFITDNKIKNLKLKTGEICSGEIMVSNNNGHYLYIPKLTCNDISTKTLVDKLTESKNLVTTGSGLYKYDDIYIYRGENLNNYISFANKIWQIIKINSDGTLRIIDTTRGKSVTWDNRYNIEKKMKSGINDFITNDINSRIKDTLNNIYNNNEEFTDDNRAYFVKYDLCTGKRSINETINNGQIECSQIIEDQVFGLVQANEYLLASLDPNCSSTLDVSCINYNYLASDLAYTWTITADADTSDKVYRISSSLSLSSASNSSAIKIVAHLNKDVLYSSGTGTLEDPYIIK